MREEPRRRRKARGGAEPLVSLRLDPATWEALQIVAARQRRAVADLVADIARDALGVAIRIYLEEFRRAADTTDEGSDP